MPTANPTVALIASSVKQRELRKISRFSCSSSSSSEIKQVVARKKNSWTLPLSVTGLIRAAFPARVNQEETITPTIKITRGLTGDFLRSKGAVCNRLWWTACLPVQLGIPGVH